MTDKKTKVRKLIFTAPYSHDFRPVKALCQDYAPNEDNSPQPVPEAVFHAAIAKGVAKDADEK